MNIHHHMIRTDKLKIVRRVNKLDFLIVIFVIILNCINNARSELKVEIIKMNNVRLKYVKKLFHLVPCFPRINGFKGKLQLL